MSFIDAHRAPAVFESAIPALPLVNRGKVRDVYAVDDERLLIIVTDRLSAFDVVLPDPIPGKGIVLTQLANFWFRRTRHLVRNHLLDEGLDDVLARADARAYRPRASLVRRLDPLPVEAVVRGYLLGSGWQDYQRTGQVGGIPLPAGLRLAERLPEPLFTPATKAAAGEHDENIDFATCARLIGEETAQRVRATALALYRFAADRAAARGILIADTKFEFALDGDELVLIDEALTPDSSRFWPADAWTVGTSPPSFDKQFVRDHLAGLDWDRKAPAPHLPAAVVRGTAERYETALRLLTEEPA